MKLTLAALVGASAVAAGAFGAHALRARLPEDLLAIWNTGAHYHLVHAVMLVALALFERASGKSVTLPFALVAAGLLFFSGSLYALALSGVRVLGAVTPIGGVCFIAGWVSLLWLAR